jgi:hypothetical protein
MRRALATGQVLAFAVTMSGAITARASSDTPDLVLDYEAPPERPPSTEAPSPEIAAWERQRNAAGTRIRWMFRVDDRPHVRDHDIPHRRLV